MPLPIQAGLFPASLGRSILSGLPLNVWTKTARRAAQEAGKGFLKLALRRSASRLTGKMLTGSKAWAVAFKHIAEHFSLGPLATKATHTVFVQVFRNKKACEALIAQAVKGPSRRYISRATVHGVTAGRPVIILEREFQHLVGETFSKAAPEAKPVACRILRVIVDFTGKPITAYPIEVFGAVL